MALKEDIKPITYLKNHAADLVASVEENRRPVVITKNGTAKVVVLDVESYDQWRKTTAMLKIIAQSESDARAGRTVSQEEVFAYADAVITATSRNV